MGAVKNFQKLWEERALKDQEVMTKREERLKPLREAQAKLEAEKSVLQKREAISAEELEGSAKYTEEQEAAIQAEIDRLQATKKEQEEHTARLIAEAAETKKIEEEKQKDAIAQKLEDSGIAVPTPPTGGAKTTGTPGPTTPGTKK